MTSEGRRPDQLSLILEGLEVEQFKAVGSAQKFDFAPLTLIYGPNSGGKSSVLHSLLYLKEAVNLNSADVRAARSTDGVIDFGGMDGVVHSLSDEFTLSVVLPAAAVRSSSGIPNEVSKVGLRLTFDRRLGDLSQVGIDIDGSPFWQGQLHRQGSRAAIEGHVLDRDAPWVQSLAHAHHRDQQTLFPGATQQNLFVDPFASDFDIDPMRFLPWAKATANRQHSLVAAILNYVVEAVERTMAQVSYLGPSRASPARFTRVGSRGEDALGPWQQMVQSEKNRHQVNTWLRRLGLVHRVIERRYVELDSALENHLSDVLPDVLENFLDNYQDQVRTLLASWESRVKSERTGAFDPLVEGLADDILRRIWEHSAGRFRDVGFTSGYEFDRNLSHKDLGFGVSQVLPLIVECALAKNRLIVVEQPELHLHPAMQAEVGDLLLSSVCENGSQLLIETHSEHMLLRIMRRIREGFENARESGETAWPPPDIVKILYVDNAGSGPAVVELPLNEAGELIREWPHGFFEEGLREIL